MLKNSTAKLLVNFIFLVSSLAAETGGSVSIVHSSQTIVRNTLGTTGYTITSPGYYTLGEDIPFNADASATAITIASSSVTLDMNNRTLSQSNTSTGVTAIKIESNVHDLVIKNGTVSGFTAYGLYHDASSTGTGAYNVTVDHLDIAGMPSGSTNALRIYGNGVQNSYSQDWSFHDCKFIENNCDWVCFVQDCENVSMENCKINGNNATSVVFYGTYDSDITLKNCDISSNISPRVVYLSNSSGVVFEESVFVNNDYTDGDITILYLSACAGGIVRNCNFSRRNLGYPYSIYGIYITGGKGNIIESCRLSSLNGSSVYGVYCGNYTTGAVVSDCVINGLAASDGSAYGIYFAETVDGQITNCNVLNVTSSSGSGYGIYLASSASKTALTGNKTYSNKTSGIYNDSSSTLMYDCTSGANGTATTPTNFTGAYPAKTGESTGSFAQGEYGNGLDYVDGKVYIYASAIGTSGLTISNPGYYVLAEDVTFTAGSGVPAISINSSYVTLDMNNKAIYQSGSTANVDGISISSNTHDITIKNGTLSGFRRYGLVNDVDLTGTGAYNVTVDNLDITGMPSVSTNAIRLFGNTASGLDVHDWSFSHCTITDNNVTGTLCYFSNGNNISMSDCAINGNTASNRIIYGASSSNFLVKSCDISSNSSPYIISLATGNGCIIDGCKLNNNSSPSSIRCIDLSSSCTGCIVRDSIVSKNSGSSTVTGINLSAGSGNMVESCEINSLNGAEGYGIFLGSSELASIVDKCVVQNFYASAGTARGIYLGTTNDCQIKNSEVLSVRVSSTTFAGTGILVAANSNKTVLAGNKTYSNSTYGIYNQNASTLIYDCVAGANGTATSPSNFAGAYPAVTGESNGNFAQGQYGNGLDYKDGKIYIYASAIGTSGLIISDPGYYELTEDIPSSVAGYAITISGNYVTLDMNNKTIYRSTGTSGINIAADTHDITIKNGTLSGFTGYGLNSGAGAYNVTVDHLDITGMASTNYPISLQGTSGNYIHDWSFSHCTVTENTSTTWVVYLNYCKDISMNYCKVNGNAASYLFYATTDYKIVLENCEFCNNTAGAILEFLSGAGCIVDRCIVNDNSAQTGVVLGGCTGCNLRNCMVDRNSTSIFSFLGIVLETGYGNLIESCQVDHNTGVSVENNPSAGIYLNDYEGSVARGCTISYLYDSTPTNTTPATAAGIYIFGDYHFVEDCEITRIKATNSGGGSATGYGIWLDTNAERNVVYKCKSVANTTYGFYDNVSTNTNAVTACIAAVNPTNFGGAALLAGVSIARGGAAATVTVNDQDNISIG